MLVEVHAKGMCVTRNGEFPLGAVRLELGKDGVVRLWFVSSRLRRVLHAGASIDLADMDKLALEWVRARSLGGGKRAVDREAMRAALGKATAAIAEARGELEKSG